MDPVERRCRNVSGPVDCQPATRWSRAVSANAERSETTMPATPDRGDDSFEVDRHIDDQPVRDDLIDPDDIDPARVEEPTMDEEVGELPLDEELPESQGVSPLDAERFTEDAKAGPRLADEVAEDWGMEDELVDPVERGLADEGELGAELAEPGLVDPEVAEPTDTP
jgi:hypothetical protein